jgi:hypothetical protein
MTDLTPDAQLLLRHLALHPDEPAHALILQLIPHGIVDLIGDKMDEPEETWSEGAIDLMQHYVDDAQERAKRALQELSSLGYVSKDREEA